MKFEVDEISSVIRQEIASFRGDLDVRHVGRVLEAGDGIARIYGLSGVKAGEMLRFERGAMGQVFNLEEDCVGAVVFAGAADICQGDTVHGTGQLLEVPVGEAMLGRVVDPLGAPVDGAGAIAADGSSPIERTAPGIAARQPVNVPLQTGIKAIDAMTAIGRGQRELIVGDRKTGKTTIAIDTILNQKGTGVLCVYVAIGQKESTVAGVVETLRAHGVMDSCVVVVASSADPAPLQYIAPYAGCTIAEYFTYGRGADTLVVYDDLSKQAVAYRQLSLLLRRPPGREAYPGDVFYLHSRLLERSVKLAEAFAIVPDDTPADADLRACAVNGRLYLRKKGRAQADQDRAAMPDAAVLTVRRLPTSGGSLTALPIIETLAGEVAAYIPTNVISITDGQIYLEPDLFFAGIRPAINVGISVSRVGGKAQRKAMKKVAGSLRLDLASYRELEAFVQLGTEVDPATQKRLDRGALLTELLKQPQEKPCSFVDEVIGLYAGTRGFLDELPLGDVQRFEAELLAHVHAECGELCAELERTGDIDAELDKQLAAAIGAFVRAFTTIEAPAAAEPKKISELEQAARELGVDPDKLTTEPDTEL